MLLFNDFTLKYKLKIKATSNLKIHQVHHSIGLNNADIRPSDGPFEPDMGVVNLHLSKKHLGLYISTKIYLTPLVLLLLKTV